jgi:hypothetical protein
MSDQVNTKSTIKHDIIFGSKSREKNVVDNGQAWVQENLTQHRMKLPAESSRPVSWAVDVR